MKELSREDVIHAIERAMEDMGRTELCDLYTEATGEDIDTTNESGDVITDAELRDAEYVPLREDIAAYFTREVTPHWPDAWVNEDVKDKQDKATGVVGCEINFNREFYVYKPPRSRTDIQAEIEAMEKRFMSLLHGVSK